MTTSSKTVELKLKVTPEKSPQVAAGASKLQKEVEKTQKVITAQTRGLDDMLKRLGAAGSAMRSLGSAAQSAGGAMKSAFGQVDRSITGINAKIDGFKSKFLNLKTLLVGSAVGAAAFGVGRKILSEGRGDFMAANKLRRRFGANAGLVGDMGSAIAQRAGFDDDPVTAGLSEIFDATNDVQAGTRFKGKKLNEAQAAAIRKQTFDTGSKIFERLLKLNPEQDPENLGRIVAEAGTGSEGFRRLAGALGLNRVESKKIAAALEKGKLYEAAGPEAAKRLGIKKGDRGTGSGLELLLDRTGQSESAAADATKSFDFQMRSVGATIDRTIGDIGLSVFEKLNKEIGKGGDLAKKFQDYLSSPQGKRTLDGISSALATTVSGLVKIATTLPTVFDIIERNKTTLMLIGGAYAALRTYGAVKGALGGGGIGGAIAGAGIPGVPAGVTPVFVVNQGGSLIPELAGGAAAAGKAAGRRGLGSLLAGIAGPIAAVAAPTAALMWLAKDQSDHTDQILKKHADANPVDPVAAKYFGTGYARASKATMRRGSLQFADDKGGFRDVSRDPFGDLMGQLGSTAGAAVDFLASDAGQAAVAQASQEKMPINIGSIVLQGGAGLRADQLVDSILPALRERLVRSVSVATAGGAAPGGAR